VVYFSDANLELLQTGRSAVAGKCQQLVQSYTMRHYKDSRAREFATQGFSRRLKTLARCVDNVFEILPPDLVEPPTDDKLLDVAQAHLTLKSNAHVMRCESRDSNAVYR